MREKKQKLAEAELRIMNAIWQEKRPVTVKEIHQALFPKGEKAYTTVQTVMNILADKHFLTRKKIGMVNFYQPTLSKDEYAKIETENFVSRIFKGSFGELAAYLVSSGELSDEDLQDLKQLIAQKQERTHG